MIRIIAAMSKNRVIGNDNSLIWSLPDDLEHFKKITLNNTIIMGRKTFESIGKALPCRRNIVVTRDNNYEAIDCEIVSSLDEALLLSNNDCFIIGGGEIYKQSLKYADKIYLTVIDKKFEGDTYFPEINNSWIKVSKVDWEADDKNKYNYSFIEYEKCKF